MKLNKLLVVMICSSGLALSGCGVNSVKDMIHQAIAWHLIMHLP
jgi:hypothetical protein